MPQNIFQNYLKSSPEYICFIFSPFLYRFFLIFKNVLFAKIAFTHFLLCYVSDALIYLRYILYVIFFYLMFTLYFYSFAFISFDISATSKSFFQRISISFHILIAVVFLGFLLLQRILRYNRSISFLISIIVILSLIYYYWKKHAKWRWNTNYTTHNFTDISVGIYASQTNEIFS